MGVFALCVAVVQSAGNYNINTLNKEYKKIICDFMLYTGSCPLSSQVTTCTPKCTNDLECSSIGGSCCPNICNTKSCSRPKSGTSGTDKYSSMFLILNPKKNFNSFYKIQ